MYITQQKLIQLVSVYYKICILGRVSDDLGFLKFPQQNCQCAYMLPHTDGWFVGTEFNKNYVHQC